jgi:hypothetical protein
MLGRAKVERRLRAAHIGRFKPLCDFDWTWPKRCDGSAFEALSRPAVAPIGFLRPVGIEWLEFAKTGGDEALRRHPLGD